MWTSGTLENQTTAANVNVGFDALGAFTLTEKHNISGLVTVHYEVMVRAATIGDIAGGAFGLIVAEDDAIAAASFPEPIGDVEGPWAVHRLFQLKRNDDVSEYLGGQGKSRRNIPIKHSLLFCFQTNTGGNTVEWSVHMRILLQRGR